MEARNKLQPEILTGSVLGIGFIPFAPGTFASFVSLLPLGFILWYSGREGLLMYIILTSLLTIWAARLYENQYGRDAKSFVMDEWAGQGVVFLFIPLRGEMTDFLILLGTGFLLFRFFDIVKPAGIGSLQKVPDGFGILLDDLLAGIYALICLHLLILYVL
ncbi:MAG: phosphatidylglycerophosphatase A [Cyclonatronaceae bacterium]